MLQNQTTYVISNNQGRPCTLKEFLIEKIGHKVCLNKNNVIPCCDNLTCDSEARIENMVKRRADFIAQKMEIGKIIFMLKNLPIKYKITFSNINNEHHNVEFNSNGEVYFYINKDVILEDLEDVDNFLQDFATELIDAQSLEIEKQNKVSKNQKIIAIDILR
jgi:hypothetical protein